MTHTFEAEAIVLDCIDHGESDLIVTLYSQEVGRLSAIAKGAKKSKKRFVNKLELFTFLHIGFWQKGSGLAFLSEAELHTSFLNIRLSPVLYTVASAIREFLLVGVKEGEPDKKIFRLTLWALHNLNNAHPPKTVLILFLIRFFGHIGYRPELESCIGCSSRANIRLQYRFDFVLGGIVCSKCGFHHTRQTLPISQGTIMMLLSAQDMPLERLHRLKISGSSLQESMALLQNYGHQLFQRDIISWKSVRRLTTSS